MLGKQHYHINNIPSADTEMFYENNEKKKRINKYVFSEWNRGGSIREFESGGRNEVEKNFKIILLFVIKTNNNKQQRKQIVSKSTTAIGDK